MVSHAVAVMRLLCEAYATLCVCSIWVLYTQIELLTIGQTINESKGARCDVMCANGENACPHKIMQK